MKLILRLIILLAFGYIFYLFFYGALLFLNPIKIEYEQFKGSRYDVYIKDIAKLDPVYYEIEDDMTQAEELTGLKFTRRPTFYVASDRKEFSRFIPWVRNNENLVGAVLWVKNVIYINSEKIQQRGYTERDIIRNKLIQNLFLQNSILVNYVLMNNQQWFIGGLAGYFGGPKYLSDLQFMQQFQDYQPNFDLTSQKIFVKLPDDTQFSSSLYRAYIKYLIETYGKDRFKIFLKHYIDSPIDFSVDLYTAYDEKMVLVIEEFMNRYR